MSTESLCISISQVKAFISCPRKYEFRYVRGVAAEFLPANLAFGSSFHEMAAFLFGDLKVSGEVPPLEQLNELFHDSWRKAAEGPLPLQPDEDADADWARRLAIGLKMVATFRSHVASVQQAEVLAVEMPFLVDLHHPETGEVMDEKLIGVIDAVLVDDGRSVITELKTAARRYSADQLADIQMSAYAYAAEQLGYSDAALKYLIVTKAKAPVVQEEFLRRDERDLADLLHTAAGVLRSIDAGVSFPIRSWQCRSCEFQRTCSSKR